MKEIHEGIFLFMEKIMDRDKREHKDV